MMNLKYVDFNNSIDKKTVKKIYNESFKRNERFPFWLLKKCSRENNVKFNVIYNNSKIVGFQYIVEYDNIAYLMYLAIKKELRNKGNGMQILKDLKDKYNNVVLSIERIDEEINNTKFRRKQFYLRNGYISANRYIIDNNVEYEVLCSNSQLNVTNEILEKRYTMMTNSKILRFIISKLFNVYNIKLK